MLQVLLPNFAKGWNGFQAHVVAVVQVAFGGTDKQDDQHCSIDRLSNTKEILSSHGERRLGVLFRLYCPVKANEVFVGDVRLERKDAETRASSQ